MNKMTNETLNAFAKDLNQLRDETKDTLGSRDARYIRKMIAIQRICEISGRVLMVMGFISPFRDYAI